MKPKHYIIAGLCLFILVTAFTNPGTEKHKEEVKLKMNAFLEKEIDKENTTSNNQMSEAGGILGNALAQSMVNMLVDNIVSSSNYIIFSTTDVTVEGKTKTIGFGILGNVFLSSKIDEAIKQ
ncbi:DUF4359 domain-containing protein [Flavobacterium sp. LHD-85]|uniref:DUF4359 domain-containing protein n=1 Tax=Flavobacterium sp. LHD-85 TaxID=3071410 RepID=UPI0027E151CD|nr:DUF4359 domain-containing protein [Flavobacterium sp. LHD-85]MDQ6530094.1 DUF4359 domain-containing protein [Flavobacterium sp. LHD-85]